VLVRDGRARGVEVERHGRVHEMLADRVVLCGGAIATPGILLRSGVGPPADVARLGVELACDVPGVGTQLFDHPGVAIFFKPHASGMSRTDHPLVQTVHRYASVGSACPNDMQVQPGSWIPIPHFPLAGVTLAAVVGKPRSVGRLRFESTRPLDAPRIETALLSHPDDRTRMLEALAIIGRLAKTKALSSLARPVYPARNPFDASGQFAGRLEQITGSGYHPCGTVPMGVSVDSRGNVRGVRGLVVADASIMPTIPSSNTNLPSLMIGERIAEWLREM
jgi:choline dehydrogenase